MHLPVEIIDGSANEPLILVCDHASNYIPKAWNDLGLNKDILQTHIGWDIGAGSVTKSLQKLTQSTAILAGFSRLLIDANRGLDSFDVIPEKSDGVEIPGNMGIDENEREHRIRDFYDPFHAACAKAVSDKKKNGIKPALVSIHSFTPSIKGEQRPWEVAVMWNKDEHFAHYFGHALARMGYNVGWNEPYSGEELFFTMNEHGGKKSVPHVLIEIRQDLVSTLEDTQKWAHILFEVIQSWRTDKGIEHA